MMRFFAATAACAVASLLFIGGAGAAERDHYLCYTASPSFKPTTSATQLPFTDSFQSRDYDAVKAKHLCLPVDKDGNPVKDASTALTSYKIKLSKELPVQAVPASVSTALLTTPQGFAVYTKKPEYLLVPAAKCPSGSCPAPTAGSNDVDHYACYTAKLSSTYCALDAPQNPGLACTSQADCGGSGCTVQDDKFPKTLTTLLQSDFAVAKRFSLKKLKHFCTAVDVSHTGRLHPNARLLCYQVKPVKTVCSAGAPDNALESCASEEDCGGTSGTTTFCAKQSKLAPQSVSVGDQFAADRPVTAKKEDEVCIDACDVVSPYVVKLTSLQIGTDGNPGNGVDVDGNLATCSPSNSDCTASGMPLDCCTGAGTGNCCSDGIDNEFASLAGLANPSLVSAVSSGSILLLVELNGVNLASGSHPTTLKVYSAILDPANSGCDPQHESCNYLISNTCAAASFPATLTNGTTLTGGGPGTDFTIDVPLGGTPLPITIHNLQLQGTVSTSGTSVTGVTGVLGGAFIKQELINTILSLPDGTILGLNSADVAAIVDAALPVDIDLNGDMVNDATSIGLPFIGIQGAVTGLQP